MFEIIFTVFLLVVAILMLATSWVIVGKKEYLLISWNFPFLPNPRQGHFIARGIEQGLRATVYTAGIHFIPFVNLFGDTTKRPPLHVIPGGKFGLVNARDGEPLKPGQLVAERAVECNNFLDGDEFLRNGGQKGIQIPLLSPGEYPINEEIFEIRHIDPVIIGKEERELQTAPGTAETVPNPFVGIVTLNIGEEIPEESGRIIGRHVAGHENFQNIAPFIGDQILVLDKSGNQKLEQGIQLDVLEQGAYAINTEIVRVRRVLVPFVPEGKVAVLISSIGEMPYINPGNHNDPKNDVEFVSKKTSGKSETTSGKLAFILKRPEPNKKNRANMRGIRPDIIDPGFVPYSFAHPIAYKTVMIDTTPTTIDWATNDEFVNHKHIGTAMNFEPIDVVTSEGFTIPTKAELVIIIKSRTDAPKIVALAGSEKGLVTDIVVPIFDDIAKRIISEKKIEDLIKGREKIRKAIQTKVSGAIGPYYVTTVSFRISEFDFIEHVSEEVRAYIRALSGQATAEQERAQAVAQVEFQRARIKLEKLRAQADNQDVLVKAEFQKRASEDQKAAIVQRKEGLEGVDALKSFVVDPNAIPSIMAPFIKKP